MRLSVLFRGYMVQLWQLLALLLVILAVYVVLGRQLLPLINNKKDQIAEIISSQIGYPVSIGELHGTLSGFSPSLSASQVSIGSVLFVDHMRFDLSILPTLAQGRPIAKFVSMSGVQMEMRQKTESSGWSIGDWQLSRKQSAEPVSLGRFLKDIKPLFDNEQIYLSDIQLNLQFAAQRAMTVELSELQAISVGNEKTLNFIGRLGAESPLSGFQGAARFWNWDQDQPDADIYFDQEDFDWAPWMSLRNTGIQWDVFRSQSNYRILLKAGKLDSIHGRVKVPELSLSQNDRRLELQNVDSDLTMEFGQDRTQAWLSGLTFQFQNNTWKPSKHYLFWNGESLEINSNRLDVEVLANLANVLVPQGKMTDLQPRGRLYNSRIVWRTTQPPADRLTVQGRFANVSTDPWQGVPGLSDMNGYIDMTPGHGLVTVTPSDTSMTLKGVLDSAVDVDALQGQVEWFWYPGNSLRVSGHHIIGQPRGLTSASADFGVFIPFKSPNHEREPRFDLNLAFSGGGREQLEQALPIVMDRQLRQWLLDSVRSFSNDHGALVISTPLIGNTRNGISVLLKDQLQDVDFVADREWPMLHNLSGSVDLSPDQLNVKVDPLHYMDLVAEDTQVSVALDQHQPDVFIETRFRGAPEAVLDFVRTSPLREFSGNTLDTWVVGGAEMSGQAKIWVPVQGNKVQAQVDVRLSDNQLVLPDYQLAVDQASGRIHFSSRTGFSSSGLHGRFFGHDAAFKIATRGFGSSDLHWLIDASGQADVADVGEWIGDALIHETGGVTPYQAQLDIQASRSQLTVTSDLTGIAMNYSSPLQKAADEVWPSTLNMQFEGDKSYLQVQLADKLSTNMLMVNNQIERGSIQSEKGAKLPEEDGVFIDIHEPKLDGDRWQENIQNIVRLYQQWPASKTDTAGTRSFDQLIREVSIRTDQLNYFTDTWPDMQVLISRTDQGWTADFEGPDVQGNMGWGHGENEPLVLDFEFVRLHSQPAVAGDKNDDPLATVDLKTIYPALVQVKRLEWDGRDFGSWSARIKPVSNGVAVTDIQGNINGLELTGSLDWLTVADGSMSTHLQSHVRAGDVGSVLEKMGYARSIRTQSAESTIELQWPGSPLAYQVETVKGKTDIHMRNGAILNVEEYEDIKLFGIFNFSRILKRLALDFSDIVQKGISFDTVDGSLLFEDGFALVANEFVIDGAATKFRFNGGYNMVDQQLDLDMVFTVPVSSAIPLAALLAGVTPQVAVAIFITERIMNSGLERFSSVKYRITGSWENPKYQLYKAFDNSLQDKKLKDKEVK
ncbi:YhdP family protein [Gynuella sunshinyii]|nr:AsmA-like C-terminal region-containing protein [Gynuella sunshinyii]